MSDSTQQRVNAVYLYLTGSFTSQAGWTDHTEGLSYDSKAFFSATEVEFKGLPELSIDFSTDECEIINLPAGSQTLAQNLRSRYSYNEVGVIVYSFELVSGAINLSTVWTMFKGLLYSVKSHLKRDFISIIARSDKYYTDRVAGMTCGEQCSVLFFGDSVCQATVTTTPVTINSISGHTIGFTAKPAGVNFLYRSGNLTYQGLEIKVVDWNDTPGTSALLQQEPPSFWLGKTMNIVSGCDRTYETCDVIYSNLINMIPLGISMVSHNTYTEET